MSQELYRREAIESQGRQWRGAIEVSQPVGAWLMAVAAMAVACAVVAVLVLGSYTHRSRVVGQIVPTAGLVTVLAPAAGVLTRFDGEEGRVLAAGAPVGVVTVPRATPADGETAAALRLRLAQRRAGMQAAHAAEDKAFAARAEGLAAQLAAGRAELNGLEAELETRRRRLDIAEATRVQLRALHASGHVSALQLSQQESSALEQLGELQLLQRQAASTRRVLAQLRQAQRELPAQREAAAATLQRELAALAQEEVENEARGALEVSAPVAGLVATQLAKPGQAVQAGQPLLVLLPADASLEAELLVPSRSIGFIAPGDRVLLRYQAFPYQKFGHHEGRVAAVSRSALQPGDGTHGAGASAASPREPVYRVTVALAAQTVTAYGMAEGLKPGMLLEADVLGERRRLIEWLFEPLYAIKGRVLSS